MLHIIMVLVRVKLEIGLLGRHIKILRLLAERGPMGIVKLSHLTNIPAHRVRYSLRVLQQCGFLQPTTKGAKINQKAKNFLNDFEKEKNKLVEKIKKL